MYPLFAYIVNFNTIFYISITCEFTRNKNNDPVSLNVNIDFLYATYFLLILLLSTFLSLV